jgi:hypothetical protein
MRLNDWIVLAGVAAVLTFLILVSGCEAPPPAPPVSIHILPASNHGCEIVVKDGICTITCPFKYGCRPEGEARCVVEKGEIRNGMGCCPMYTVCKAPKCLKDGTYTGYCKDGVCTYRIPIGR